MRLKTVTIACLVAVALLLVASPTVFKDKPTRDAPREVRRAYAVRTLDYLGILLIAFVGAGVGSFLVYRQARKEYQEESIKNLRSLLEASQASRGAPPREESPGESDDAE